MDKEQLNELDKLRKDADKLFKEMYVHGQRGHPTAVIAPMATLLRNINDQLGVIIDSLKE